MAAPSYTVSIPMGKVKLNPDPECPPFKNLYQFPMGKVKISGRTVHTVKNKYQFPMGKVKQQRHTVNVFL